MLTRTLSRALAPAVRVNAVAPGTIELDDASDESSLGPLSRIPLGRYGTGRDIARGVLFLAEASYVSGQCLAIDGGASMGFEFAAPS